MNTIYLRSTYAVGASRQLRSQRVSRGDVSLGIEPGTSVSQLLAGMPELGPSEFHDDMMLCVFVNGKNRGFDYVLKDGDVLDLHLPSSGG